eukprot:188476-Ditylum_brightwellii.AAC.1
MDTYCHIVENERRSYLADDDRINVKAEGYNFILLQVRDTVGPDQVKNSTMLNNWADPVPNEKLGEPLFEDMVKKKGQNKGGKQYKVHYIPTGCASIPTSVNKNIVEKSVHPLND